LLTLTLLPSALAAACTVETAPAPAPVSLGTLVLDWSINGFQDPAQCSQGGPASVDVTIHDIDGAFIGNYRQECSVFATTIDLAPGSYVADAVLKDSAGVERTTAAPILAFTIRPNAELDIPVDFPARSFRQ
jgi:hypothetical protein